MEPEEAMVPPFYDPNRKCVKCDGAASSKFDGRNNRMRRDCQRCGYSWMELPKDFKGPVDRV